MSHNLKQQLIRLGHQNPELRKHLTPILDSITKQSSLSLKEKRQLFPTLMQEIHERIKDYDAIEVVGRITDYKASLVYDHEGIRLHFDIEVNPDADVELVLDGKTTRTYNVKSGDMWRKARAILDRIMEEGRQARYA